MLKTKGFVKHNDIIRHSKNQSGNTLIPVIIALGISAAASVAFLKQGGNLSAQAKALEAQYEIASVLQQWNRSKATKPIDQITSSDLPKLAKVGSNLNFIQGTAVTAVNPNTQGTAVTAANSNRSTNYTNSSGFKGLGFSSGSQSGNTNVFASKLSSANTSKPHLQYTPLEHSSCLMLKNTFNKDMQGIDSSNCQQSSIRSTTVYMLNIYLN
jgi:hypothetical protein